MDRDEVFMRRAIRLALRAEGRTSPNPVVGAVLAKGGRIVGEGYHKRCGSAHAEAAAIRDAGRAAKGSTLYVTLEPCDHYGRTPPCTDDIIKSGIRRVVIGMKDPNPLNNGRGIKRLINNGIRIRTGVLESEAGLINRPYIKLMTKRMPYVTVKLAQSIDGKIAAGTGDSRWITGEDSRRYAHRLRGLSDVVMTGVNTILKDDPLLTNRRARGRQPVRMVVDSRLRTPLTARIFKGVRISPVIIATAKRTPGAAAYESKGAEVLASGSCSGRVNLRNLLRAMAKKGFASVLVEGGGELAAGLAEAGLVDRFLFFIAPKIIGGRDAVTSIEGKGVSKVKNALRLRNVKIRKFLSDILIEAEAA